MEAGALAAMCHLQVSSESPCQGATSAMMKMMAAMGAGQESWSACDAEVVATVKGGLQRHFVAARMEASAREKEAAAVVAAEMAS